MGWGAVEGLYTLFEIGAFLRLRSLLLFLTESRSPFICHWQRSCFLTLFEIVAFLRLRSLRLFLTESHSPFTCHRQRSSSILRNFERCPSPREIIKICIIVNQKLHNSDFFIYNRHRSYTSECFLPPVGNKFKYASPQI